MNDLIEKLSNLRSQFNCFDENEHEAYHTLSEAIKVLSERPESCEDAVSRQILLDDLKKLKTAWKKYPVMAEQIKGVEAAIGYAEAIPSVMPNRKTGKWEIIAHESHIGGFTHVKKCSVCGVEQIIRSRFCPNCGARMDGYK